MAGHTPWPAVINLGNSLIGVSILAMPFCFKECGLILGCLLLFLGSKLNKYSCYLLLRASKVTRRSSYEMLAYHTLGSVGKLSVELCIICYLFACCVAYFIIMGDLGPAIVSKWLGLQNDDRLRAGFLIFLAMFVILPLSQKRNLDSISNVSIISIVFYLLFSLDLIIDCIPTLLAGDWINSVTFWDTSGLLRAISIFSAAFSCQTVLFAVYETLNERTPKLMEDVVNKAVTFVWTVYFGVGFFGYVLYHHNGSPKGDILLDFEPSFMSEILRLGFSISVALSFPLAVYPCRASIYTLFFSSSHSLENPHGGGGSEFIPPGKFRFITFMIVIATLMLGITIPNVETMLGINGAIMGNLTCFIFPALIILKTPNIPGKNFAKVLLFIGLLLMTTATYSNLLKAMETDVEIKPYKDKGVNLIEDNFDMLEEKKRLGDGQEFDMIGHHIDRGGKLVDDLKKNEPVADSKEAVEAEKDEPHRHGNERREPVVPDAPEEKVEVDPGGRDKVQEKEDVIDKGKEDEGEDDKREIKEEKAEKREVKEEKPAVELEVKEADVKKDDEMNREKETDQKDVDDKKDVEQEGVGVDNEEEKRHKKEAKVIQKQSKKIKELEEMQKKHAEVIENQANALEYLLKKQQEEKDAVAGLVPDQQQGLPQQPVVMQNEQLGAQQQPGVQNQQLLGQQPMVQQPLAQQPLAQQPLAQQPVVQQPLAQQPVVQQPLAQQPMVQQPLAQQPLVQQPLAQQPLVQQPLAQQPLDQQPLAQQPLAQQPLAQQPVIQQNPPVALPNQQAALPNQPMMIPNQMVAQDQQLLGQNIPMEQNQQQVLQEQQNQQLLLNQQALLANQQALLQNQQAPLQNQQLAQNQLQNQVVQNLGPALQDQPIAAQAGMELNQQPAPQQQAMAQQGAGVVIQADGAMVQQGAQQIFQQVPLQNNAILQPQGNNLLGQQDNFQPVVQLNPQMVPQQPAQAVQLQPQMIPDVQLAQQPLQLPQQPLAQQADIQPLAQQAEIQPINPQAAEDEGIDKDALHLQAREVKFVDQNLVDLPDKIEIEKRGIPMAMGGNQRALQSHGYEGDEEGGSKDAGEEESLGAADGEAGVERGEAEVKEVEIGKVEEESQNVSEDKKDVSAEVDGENVLQEGQEILKSDSVREKEDLDAKPNAQDSKKEDLGSKNANDKESKEDHQEKKQEELDMAKPFEEVKDEV